MLVSFLVVASLGGCGGPGQKAQYASAAVTAGLGVAAAAVNRAATKECWAMCRPETVCDHASGLCVPVEKAAKKQAATAKADVDPGSEYEVPPVASVDGGVGSE